MLIESLSSSYLSCQKGRPSAGGSHMSGVWGREKPRQAFPPQNLRRGCFEPVTWWLSESSHHCTTYLIKWHHSILENVTLPGPTINWLTIDQGNGHCSRKQLFRPIKAAHCLPFFLSNTQVSCVSFHYKKKVWNTGKEIPNNIDTHTNIHSTLED